MLKDDRMMGMLTFVVIMLAVGTFIQRADFFERLFGPSGPPPALVLDEVTVRAAESAIIDVLANDANLGSDAPAKLVIVTPPECGRAFVREGRIHYLGADGCIGAQSLRYGLGGEESAALRIAVEPPAGAREMPSAAEARPAKPPASAAATPEPPRDARTNVRVGALPGAASEDGGTSAGNDTTLARRASGNLADTETTQPESDAADETARPEASQDEPAPAQTTRSEEAGASLAAGTADPATGARAPADDCTLPPTLTLDTAPGAMTTVSVDSPCHAGTVAELAFDGLRFAMPLDARGRGNIAAPGFQRSVEATLTLEDHEPITFSLPFRDIERIERVAVAWQTSDGLALNAFEFGARPLGEGHVHPGAPRSFEAVRREGGGWLSTYAPAEGKGQRIEVYSFWRRYAGPSGVVRLGLDPGRPGEGCAAAEAAGADYEVLRSSAGRLERTRLGRIGALDCTRFAGGAGRFIGDAVDDLIVRRR